MDSAPAPDRAGGKVRPGSREFILLVASTMGLAALSIDMLMPAFAEMREDLGLEAGSTEISTVITTFFLGLALGQLVYGPLSDRFGRKPMLAVGLVVFALGGVAAIFATSLAQLNAARFLWGFGAAAPRSLAVAIVRDSFEGDRMARAMSFVMTAFILIPVFAPAAGTAVLAFGSWRTVVVVQILAAVVVGLWATRLGETLRPEHRRAVSPRALGSAAVAVLRHRQTLVFGVAMTGLMGVMTSFVGTIEITIDEVFDQKDNFALLFGLLAGTLAVGSLLSARLVVRIGLPRLLQVGAAYLLAAMVLSFVVAHTTGGHPPLWAYLATAGLAMSAIAVLIPSCNTAAMAPLGRVAGMGAAVLGTVTTAVGALLGSLTDRAFDGTTIPFADHVLVYAGVASIVILTLGRPAALAIGGHTAPGGPT